MISYYVWLKKHKEFKEFYNEVEQQYHYFIGCKEVTFDEWLERIHKEFQKENK